MSLLAEATLKVSLIVLFALAAAALLRNGSAAVRHWLLSAAMACAAAAPLVQPLAPSWTVQVSMPAAIAPAGQASAAGVVTKPGGTTSGASQANSPAFVPPGDRGRLSVWDSALLLWALGTLLSLSTLLAGLLRLDWLASRSARIVCGRWAILKRELARELGVNRHVVLLQSNHPSLLVTWGLRQPRIILPAPARHWSDERIRVVLLHELAHIKRRDWLTQMGAEFLRAAYWFNPLVWLASRRLRQESEHACDDAVLNGGVAGPDYATHLLALARAIRHRREPLLSAAPAMARPSSLERRFRAMLNGRLNRTPASRRSRVLTTCTVLPITLLIAGFGVAQTFSTFSGSVFDSTNRVIPSVTLTLINPQTQAKYSIKSDQTGRFEFVGLPPGDYQFEVSGIGFSTLKGNVNVAGRNVQRDLALEVGSLEETISIVGSPNSEPAAPRRYVNAARNRSHDPGSCTPSTTGGQIKPPIKVVDVRPIYPASLSASSTGGLVVLDATIGGDGYVGDVRVVTSAHPDLDAAAMEAVRQWEFSSTLLNCQPIDVKMKVTARFSIAQ